jgi:hypothetical protein
VLEKQTEIGNSDLKTFKNKSLENTDLASSKTQMYVNLHPQFLGSLASGFWSAHITIIIFVCFTFLIIAFVVIFIFLNTKYGICSFLIDSVTEPTVRFQAISDNEDENESPVVIKVKSRPESSSDSETETDENLPLNDDTVEPLYQIDIINVGSNTSLSTLKERMFKACVPDNST